MRAGGAVEAFAVTEIVKYAGKALGEMCIRMRSTN